MLILDNYLDQAAQALEAIDPVAVLQFAQVLHATWESQGQIFACGNGGSAANAQHLCNDLIYGSAPRTGHGLRAHALCCNPSTLTCLANDIGYDLALAYQLRVMAKPGDLVVIFSGSGNSPNIVNVLHTAREIGITSTAILGFDGGRCISLADLTVHIPVSDMQIVEDCQQTICHMVTRWLSQHRPMAAMSHETTPA